MIVVGREHNLLEIVAALRAQGGLAQDCTAGNNNATRTAMIAITANNSMSVNAFLQCFIARPFFQFMG